MDNRLYAGNLSPSTTEDELREAFAAYGEVASVKIITDRKTGGSKGFGFVEMSTEEEASAAISGLNGTELGGRTIKVNKARPRINR
jgi:RNA recognition motif-containing protein